MDIEQFWDLIQRARATAGAAADQAVRDYDEPDDDPDHDYWDFSELELDADLLAMAEQLKSVPSGDGSGSASSEHDTSDEDDDADDSEDDEDDEDDDEDWDDEDFSDPVALAILEQLEQLPAEEIADFERIFEELRTQADRDDLANAAILIEHGFLSDEGFEDFRAGLIALGRESFEGALRNPDSLADHPMVREIAQANDPRWLSREELLYVSSRAYATVTGEDELAFDDVLSATDAADDAEAPEGPSWELTDEAATRRHLPRLADLFYTRSMSNRERAMEKLGLSD